MNLPSATIRRMQASLNRYCLALTGSCHDAEDLVQDTWMKLLSSNGAEGHANPEALLLRIARTTWIDQVRRKKSFSRMIERQQREAITHWQDERGCELGEIFCSLFKHMSPLQRTVFLLRELWGYPAAAVAEALHTTEGAVKSALHRARQALPAVRKELIEETAAIEDEQSLQELLHIYIAAYLLGDADVLVQLVRLESIEPVAAVAITINSRHNTSAQLHGGSPGMSVSMAMAA